MTEEPIIQFSPIFTLLSIMLLDPITEFFPILTFLPISTFFPNDTFGKDDLIFSAKSKLTSGISISANYYVIALSVSLFVAGILNTARLNNKFKKVQNL